MNGDIRDHAIKLARTTGWYAVRIFEDLEDRFGERDKFPNKRTIESYDKLGRRRVSCANSGAPVTGEIAVQTSKDGRTSRWILCPECKHIARVTGSKTKPRLTVHNAVGKP